MGAEGCRNSSLTACRLLDEAAWEQQFPNGTRTWWFKLLPVTASRKGLPEKNRMPVARSAHTSPAHLGALSLMSRGLTIDDVNAGTPL